MKIRWPWIARWRYDAACEAIKVFEHVHAEYMKLLPSRRLVDPAWRDSEKELRRLADWFYNYEGKCPENAKETVELFTERYLELREIAIAKRDTLKVGGFNFPQDFTILSGRDP